MNDDRRENGSSEPKIIVDEDWKTQAQAEKEQLQQEVERRRAAQQSGGTASSAKPEALPPPSMMTLITSLATQAAIALQGGKTPQGDSVMPDLPVARHLIDTLEVLRQKTLGNLTDEESKMLQEVQNQLQLLYVETVTYLEKQAKPDTSTSGS